MGRETRPHALQRGCELGRTADLAPELLHVELIARVDAEVAVECALDVESGEQLGGRARRLARAPLDPFVLGGEHPDDLLVDEATAGVVGAGPTAGTLDDGLGVPGAQAQDPCPERDRHVLTQRPLPGPHRPGEDARHPFVALQARRVGCVGTADLDLRDEARDGRERDPGLPEGRQHLFDVAQEERVGPDDQHTLALERETVRVEQIGGTVEGDGRLARPGATLDEEDAGQR